MLLSEAAERDLALMLLEMMCVLLYGDTRLYLSSSLARIPDAGMDARPAEEGLTVLILCRIGMHASLLII